MKSNSSALIIDDDPVFCRLMTHLLASWGIRVEAFTEPAKFLERAKATSPRLCLVDLNLGAPLMGFEVITSLRQCSSETIVFVVSGTRDAKLVAHALEIGANDYLVKPIDREVLVGKLSRYLQTQALEVARPKSAASRSVEVPTELKLEAKIIGVDELGITILSPHLIAKGAVLSLSGDLVRTLTGRPNPLEVSVLSASLEEGSESFRIYFEFRTAESKVIEQIHAWLGRQGQ